MQFSEILTRGATVQGIVLSVIGNTPTGENGKNHQRNKQKSHLSSYLEYTHDRLSDGMRHVN
jgi:hypothetical protein